MKLETTVTAPESAASTIAQPDEVHYTKGIGAGTTHTRKITDIKPVIKARPAPKLPKSVKKTAVKKSTKKTAVKKSTKKTAVKKSTKKSTKKTAVKATQAPRALHTFILAAKADLADFGSGQRLAIAKLLKKGTTRAELAAKLPDVPVKSISWHLSMMVKNGEAKKTAAK
jgi:hypothetical protein